ncbi:hypothetical protein RIF29_15919 [Crotalaria pallida]|uniref:Uncharacterized protein n=1 Tax=Crotalaria pallida TaxID=3830 RepID=A0AAN9FFK1_CROPI
MHAIMCDWDGRVNVVKGVANAQYLHHGCSLVLLLWFIELEYHDHQVCRCAILDLSIPFSNLNPSFHTAWPLYFVPTTDSHSLRITVLLYHLKSELLPLWLTRFQSLSSSLPSTC